MFIITQPPNRSIIVVRIFNPFDPQHDLIHIMQDIGKLLGHITGVFYIIYDVRELTLTFPDVVKGLANAFRSTIPERDALKERGRMIVVGAGQIVDLAVKGAQRLQPEQPGVKLCDTMEEAMNYAREQLAKTT